MHYLKLTIQRNRRRIQIEQLLLLLLRIALPVLLFFFLARPVLNPTGLEQLARRRRAVEPGRPDRRLAEHGLRRAAGRRRSTAPARSPAALLAAVRPAGPLHARRRPRPRAPRSSTRSRATRRDELVGRRASRCR